MKLGCLTNLFGDKTLDEALAILVPQGVQMVEIGAGGYPGKAHCDPDVLLNDDKALQAFKDTLDKWGVQISALSCHGNPVHPNKEIAAAYDRDFRQTVLLAEKLGVRNVNTFSGCPGDSPTSQRPNWVVCPWPEDFLETLDYQWNEVLIPYWKDAAAFALAHGVDKIGLELHPGFCCYNTETLLRLRAAVGDVIGANLDPSHLIWQGMDLVSVIRELGPAIHHFHAKDTKVDALNTGVNGVLDTKHYGDELHRSWIFRSVGYGHDAAYWKEIVSNLRLVGYDYVLSIEHEDSLMSQQEGLSKAISMLKDVLIFEGVGKMTWA